MKSVIRQSAKEGPVGHALGLHPSRPRQNSSELRSFAESIATSSNVVRARGSSPSQNLKSVIAERSCEIRPSSPLRRTPLNPLLNPNVARPPSTLAGCMTDACRPARPAAILNPPPHALPIDGFEPQVSHRALRDGRRAGVPNKFQTFPSHSPSTSVILLPASRSFTNRFPPTPDRTGGAKKGLLWG
jgi:hypothetical protein